MDKAKQSQDARGSNCGTISSRCMLVFAEGQEVAFGNGSGQDLLVMYDTENSKMLFMPTGGVASPESCLEDINSEDWVILGEAHIAQHGDTSHEIDLTSVVAAYHRELDLQPGKPLYFEIEKNTPSLLQLQLKYHGAQ